MPVFSLSLLATLVATATAASLQQVENFGANPGGLAMYIYVPDNVKPNAAVILSVRNPMSLRKSSE
jgi:acetylxylan esterase